LLASLIARRALLPAIAYLFIHYKTYLNDEVLSSVLGYVRHGDGIAIGRVGFCRACGSSKCNSIRFKVNANVDHGRRSSDLGIVDYNDFFEGQRIEINRTERTTTGRRRYFHFRLRRRDLEGASPAPSAHVLCVCCAHSIKRVSLLTPISLSLLRTYSISDRATL